MIEVDTERDFATLFSIPFNPQKIFYSLNSEYFQEGNKTCRTGEKQLAIEIDDEELLHNPLPEFPCGEQGCRAIFTTVHDYEIHYRSAHSLICSECKKTFPSYNLLDIHIQEKHDTYYGTAADRNLARYCCIIEGCDELFASPDRRNEHVIKVHNYPPDFKFQQLKIGKKCLEKMDTTQTEYDSQAGQSKNIPPKPSVPRNICFGRGSARAFPRRGKKKSSSQDISMKELADAL